MPERFFISSDAYRFGFQGQESDDEIKGDGNSIFFKYRVHDPRIGRFLSIDPLAPKYPFYSPYAFSGNRVIDAVELEGLEPEKRGSEIGEQAVAEDRIEGEANHYLWTWTANENATNFEESAYWKRGDNLDYLFVKGKTKWRQSEMWYGDGELNFPLGKDWEHIYYRWRNESVEDLERNLLRGLSFVSTKDMDGALLFYHFKYGGGEDYLFESWRRLSKDLADESRFLDVVEPFENSLLKYYLKNGSIDGFVGEDYLGKPDFGGKSIPGFMWSWMHDAEFTAFMGNTSNFSASVVSITEVENTTVIKIRYALGDHFSAGEGDHNRGLTGLQSMYILQHFVNMQPEYQNMYRPFRWEVEVFRTIEIPK